MSKAPSMMSQHNTPLLSDRAGIMENPIQNKNQSQLNFSKLWPTVPTVAHNRKRLSVLPSCHELPKHIYVMLYSDQLHSHWQKQADWLYMCLCVQQIQPTSQCFTRPLYVTAYRFYQQPVHKSYIWTTFSILYSPLWRVCQMVGKLAMKLILHKSPVTPNVAHQGTSLACCWECWRHVKQIISE